jgi:hypothetical protein
MGVLSPPPNLLFSSRGRRGKNKQHKHRYYNYNVTIDNNMRLTTHSSDDGETESTIPPVSSSPSPSSHTAHTHTHTAQLVPHQRPTEPAIHSCHSRVTPSLHSLRVYKPYSDLKNESDSRLHRLLPLGLGRLLRLGPRVRGRIALK